MENKNAYLQFATLVYRDDLTFSNLKNLLPSLLMKWLQSIRYAIIFL